MSLWVDKHRPTNISKLDYHKDQAENLRKLVCEWTRYGVAIIGRISVSGKCL